MFAFFGLFTIALALARAANDGANDAANKRKRRIGVWIDDWRRPCNDDWRMFTVLRESEQTSREFVSKASCVDNVDIAPFRFLHLHLQLLLAS